MQGCLDRADTLSVIRTPHEPVSQVRSKFQRVGLVPVNGGGCARGAFGSTRVRVLRWDLGRCHGRSWLIEVTAARLEVVGMFGEAISPKSWVYFKAMTGTKLVCRAVDL